MARIDNKSEVAKLELGFKHAFPQTQIDVRTRSRNGQMAPYAAHFCIDIGAQKVGMHIDVDLDAKHYAMLCDVSITASDHTTAQGALEKLGYQFSYDVGTF